MRYVKENKIYTMEEIRQENPNMSIPADADCLSLGFEFLEEVEAPVQDGFYAVEVAPINNKQTWELIEIPKEVPQSITPRQARLVLLDEGLLDDVETLVESDRRFEIYWEYATEISITDPVLIHLTQILKIDQEKLNKLFLEASKL